MITGVIGFGGFHRGNIVGNIKVLVPYYIQIAFILDYISFLV
jgi:hypothetical protein